MTWLMCLLRGKSFANSSSLLDLTLPIHNEALTDDELTTIRLNHEWRRIVTSALFYYFKHGKSELALDNEDLLDDLLADIYDTETFMGLPILKAFTLPANRNRANAVFAAVSGASVSYTPTKAKAHFTFLNVVAGISLNAELGSFRIRCSHGTIVAADYEWGVGRTDIMSVSGSIAYENLPIGTPVNVFLEFASTGGATVTMYAEHNTIVVIQESD